MFYDKLKASGCSHLTHSVEMKLGQPDIDIQIMVLKYLGCSLSEKMTESNIGSIAKCGPQMIDRIKTLHNHGIIHCDIKPSNVVLGADEMIHIIDFGDAHFYLDNNIHIPFQTGCAFRGTYMFASVNALEGIKQTRRDDLESLGYAIIYIISKTLPWYDDVARIKKDYVLNRTEEICKIRKNISLHQLTENLPKGIYKFMEYVMSLAYTEEPNYDYLAELLSSMNDRD